jgi:hypothetical protein
VADFDKTMPLIFQFKVAETYQDDLIARRNVWIGAKCNLFVLNINHSYLDKEMWWT